MQSDLFINGLWCCVAGAGVLTALGLIKRRRDDTDGEQRKPRLTMFSIWQKLGAYGYAKADANHHFRMRMRLYTAMNEARRQADQDKELQAWGS